MRSPWVARAGHLQPNRGGGKDPLQGGRLGIHLPGEERATEAGKTRVQK